MPSVLQDWVIELPLMQQTVLISAIRNADMVEKGHPSKELIKWYRRCVLKSALDNKVLENPYEAGGGSFTGSIESVSKAQDDFIRARDGMSLHYYAHCMHAFEILGYHHPRTLTREGWAYMYRRMVQALHVWPETKEQLDRRLGDTMEGWKEREDSAGGCTT